MFHETLGIKNVRIITYLDFILVAEFSFYSHIFCNEILQLSKKSLSLQRFLRKFLSSSVG